MRPRLTQRCPCFCALPPARFCCELPFNDSFFQAPVLGKSSNSIVWDLKFKKPKGADQHKIETSPDIVERLLRCLPQMRAEIAATGIMCTCGWRVPAHMQSYCAFPGTTTKVRLRFLSRSMTDRSLRALQPLRWLLADGSGPIELSEFKKMMAAFNINLTHHVSQNCCN